LQINEQTISRSDVIWEGGPHRRVTLILHESGIYVMFTEPGAALFA
jgi:hypothetical protein